MLNILFQTKPNRAFTLASILVLFASFLTYFTNYNQPNAPFWDENYHIAAAEKYITGTMFMEPHPPLGKFFIALGEYVTNSNKNTDKSSFISTDYIEKFPDNYSFTGVRLFPVLFASLSGFLIFWLFYLLWKEIIPALAFSSLYIFDNALIVHSRGAMLESTQIFFILLSLIYFTKVINQKLTPNLLNYLILGISISTVIAVKLNGLVLIVLLLFFTIKDYRYASQSNHKKIVLLIGFIKRIGAFTIGLVSIVSLSYMVHIFLGKNVNSNKYYGASLNYQKSLKDGSGKINYAQAIVDNLNFVSTYNAGVPELDVCKPTKNGSLPLEWPFGIKSINYRWEKDELGDVRYLYLQANPITWLIGIIALILSLSLIISRIIFGLNVKNKELFNYISIFSTLYIGYMVGISTITRVMYLYHYFIPLIFSFILAYLLFNYLTLDIKNRIKRDIVLGIAVFLIISTFIFYSPLTYYMPISEKDFMYRQWLKFWKLQSVK